MVIGYRIEYEADSYIRRQVWNFSILSIAFYQFVMGFVFIITGDDDIIVLAFLLLLASILSVYYYSSTEAWKGKLKKPAERRPDTFDDYEDKTDSHNNTPKSSDLKLK